QDRDREVGGSRDRRTAARRGAAAAGLDARLRHADPARPAHLQAEADLPAVRRTARLPLLSEGGLEADASHPARNDANGERRATSGPHRKITMPQLSRQEFTR